MLDVTLCPGLPTNVGLLDQADGYQTVIQAQTVEARLFASSSGPFQRTTTLSALTEMTFPGYARISISAWDGPYQDADGDTYLVSPQLLFERNSDAGPAEFAGGVYLVKQTGTQATGSATVTAGAVTAISVTNPGDTYETPPTVEITEVGGSGATAHTTLNPDGTVASVVVDTGGTGYVTPTVTIEPPWHVIGGGNFPAPVTVADATDAVVTTVPLPIGPH